ncbi:hypothetical protein LTR37_010116 [Vermiconidia calcicola]|uniref:Uncharacterized protein n=1 Tax=Vermiconidia calcicola TaxID=1690605 RepID=A0ACC3N7C8_9PEZI|nr:hypothetical protein LTR37_010116 [Vermiconidia calcicola]
MTLPRRLKRYLRRKARQSGVPRRTSLRHGPQRVNIIAVQSKAATCINKQPQNEETKPGRFHQQQSRLLNLPPGLRNKVYQHSLQEPGIIPIRHRSKLNLPVWINASKQLRNESYKMWYTINHFCLRIAHLDSTPFIGLSRYLGGNDIQPNLGINFAESYNLDNLMKWCKEVWEDNGISRYAMHHLPGGSLETAIVATNEVNMARDYRHLPRESYKRSLDTFRKTLCF